jgi:hypothetical protein
MTSISQRLSFPALSVLNNSTALPRSTRDTCIFHFPKMLTARATSIPATVREISCIGYLAHPFEKEALWAVITNLFLSVSWNSAIEKAEESFSFTRERCSHWTWWINRQALSRPIWGRFLVMRQPREAISSRSKAASECFCEHLRQIPRDLTLHPYLALTPLKRRSAPRDTRAPRAPSIVGWFCRRPLPAFVVGTVAPDGCPLVREAAGALLGVLRGDAQNDSRVLRLDMVDKSTGPRQTHFGWVFGDETVQAGLLFPE